MGKRIIARRRGRGTSTYRSPSFRFKGKVKHFKLGKLVRGEIIDLVHCPGHSSPLVKVRYDNDEIRLAFAPMGIKVGDEIFSGEDLIAKVGNTMPLNKIPTGTDVHNIESMPGDGGKFIRAAGVSAKVISKGGGKVNVLMPSKKKRIFEGKCRATVGVLAGYGRKDKPFVKAGRRYYAMKARGRLYPRTSGVAMNAVDHPFGSGRGRHIGKSKTVPRYAPAGRRVGLIRAKRAGKKK